MAIITWDKNSASAAKWAILGLVVVVLILIAVAAIVKKGPVPDARKQAFSAEGIDAFAAIFNQQCPTIATCPMAVVNAYVNRYIYEGYSIDAIPKVSEIRSKISGKLASQKIDLVNVNNFWENLDTLYSAISLEMLSKEEVVSWIKYLTSFDSANFCPRLYNMETDKNPDTILGRDIEGYGYFCHVKWVDTIYTLIVQDTQAQGNVDYFASEPNYEVIKTKLCRDISQFSTKDYFDYLYGYGYAYVRIHRFCNVPLLDREVAKIKELLKETRTDPEEENFRQRYYKYV